jgi:hypothetical protein
VTDGAKARRIRDAWAARDWGAARIWGAFLVVALVCWMFAWRSPAREARRECARWYAEARTPTDTLRIDRVGAGHGTRSGAWNCGMLRGAARVAP